MKGSLQELQEFVGQWQDGGEHNKKGFIQLSKTLETMSGVSLSFVVREGLTYSLRARHRNQSARPLFAMVDVIAGEPRWLSVCFYADMITDPGERGDFVPGGLLGEDAVCFDMDEYSEELAGYLVERMAEAHAGAAEGQ